MTDTAVEETELWGASDEEIARMMRAAEKYLERWGGGVSYEALMLAHSALRVYPDIRWSRHKTRLRRAFNLAIRGQDYSLEVRKEAKVLLCASLEYRPNSFSVPHWRNL